MEIVTDRFRTYKSKTTLGFLRSMFGLFPFLFRKVSTMIPHKWETAEPASLMQIDDDMATITWIASVEA